LNTADFNDIIHRFWLFKKFPYRSLAKKRHTEDTKHIKGVSVKLGIMLNNSNNAIGCNNRINLYFDRILGYILEMLNVQMLLNPLKQQFHLPLVFIEQYNIYRTDPKVVSEISKELFVFQRVIADYPEQDRVFFPCQMHHKPYHLIVENVIRVFKNVLAFNDFILKMYSFPYYEVGSNEIECKEQRKIKISPVKDVEGLRLVRNFIHGIHVMNFGFRNMEKCWYLGNYIIEGMYLDDTFGLTKTCPPEKVLTQIKSCRIKSIKPPANLKFFSDSLSLSDRYHFVGKLLEDLAFPISICFGKIAACYHRFTITKMVRLWRMRSNYADKFSKAFTARELTIHHYQQLIPATERLDVFVTLVLHNNTLKSFLERNSSSLKGINHEKTYL